MALPLPATFPLLTNPLITDSLALLSEYLPSPFPLLGVIDRSIPIPIKQLVAEAPLNRIFAEAIADGEFDDFEGRRIRLEVNGGHPGITFGFWAGRLRVLEGSGEATIRGSLSAFKTLSARQQDPDQLFFQRRLMIEGDTELGLALKNLLDSLEWDLNIRQLLFF
ncbi:MAG: SCP2 sterol-binding domain-containing protein [Marinobacter sp.]|uniref:ubiquinone anaerobic biosynthesis accessory factor UbiT n=1 Tax=Marinobacter sp. TaxID=50741 RepID=UPI001B673840|nr:SCP2 sterol-binding domain-containing protein [Marinobacter sp.]MBQ0748163.1 SCP2 sterol-binding domain-containing protein [Marinobacter sp.]MBQ0814911.1 SCP2 sterol-binding domain-containing protein [Marinobacter sp.]|tara:strand:- start:7241 stop:7735 length:495 start_codon:yes stop_codon:yes gene_type:complete